VGDQAKDLRLELFADANFCGEPEDTKSTSGAFLVLAGPNTLFPIAWASKRQIATSRSTTEAEVAALAMALFQEALPMLSLWEKLLARPVELRVREDNQATITVVKKGYSPKLRHLIRRQKIHLGSMKEVIDKDTVTIEYIRSELQAADIFTKALAPMKWSNALRLLGVGAVSAKDPAMSAIDNIQSFTDVQGNQEDLSLAAIPISKRTSYRDVDTRYNRAKIDDTCYRPCSELAVDQSPSSLPKRGESK